MSDEATLAAIGRGLARIRLQAGLTQADLARQAGVAKRTLERLEGGFPVQLTSFVRVLRQLDLIGSLDLIIPSSGTSPMDLLKLKGKERQRAPRARRAKPAGGAWKWGDSA